MEFVIYLGKQRQVTIADNRLSKIYRFEKGVPTPVANDADKKRVLGWRENNEGCGSCGKAYAVRPMMSDVTYCKYNNYNLGEFREKWTQFYEQQVH